VVTAIVPTAPAPVYSTLLERLQMTAIAHISKGDFLGLLRRRFPDAEIQAEDINPEYGSWRIEVRRGDAVAHISWGPLTGFGGTDFGHLSDDPDLFKSFDVGFASVEEAEVFVTRVLDADA
jgi:hypothetical protein